MKLSACAIVTALTVVLSQGVINPQTASPAENIKALYDRGTALLQKGELSDSEDSKGAISLFSEVINALESKSVLTGKEKIRLASSYNNRGLAYYDQGSDYYADAMMDFQNAAAYNPSDIKILNNLGLIYFAREIYSKEGELNDAIDWYEKARDSIPEGGEEAFHADIYSNLGVCYMKIDPPNIQEAYNAYTRAIELSGESWGEEEGVVVETVGYTEAYYNRGNLFYNENMYEDAIADYTVTIDFYEDAEEVQSDVPENAYYNRGLCYYNLGMYDNAIADYARALQSDPEYLWARYAKGFAHYMLYENDEAIEEYQRVIDSGDEEVRPYGLFGMGLVNVREKDTFDQGMDYLEQCCNTGNCSIACEALEQGLYADSGTILAFELP